MEENTNPRQPETTQGFDASKVSKNSWIITGIAAVGAIGTFLPWVKVSIFGFSASAAGTEFTWGILSLIAFALVIALTLFGNMIKLDPKQKENILKSGATLPFVGCLIFLVANTDAISYFSFGYYLSFLAAIASALIGYKIIKLK